MDNTAKTIVCFGDSNTHGYNSATMGRFTEKERWPCLLADLLGPAYLVREEGLSGRTTSFEDPLFEGLSGFAAIHPCLMTHEPVDLLIIMLGTNDTKERFGSSAACIALGLKRLVAKAVATTDCWGTHGPRILIVVPKTIDKEYESTAVGATMGRGCAEKSEGLIAEYKTIANLTNCFYFDANEVVAENNHIDYMHLTKEGHQSLAKVLSGLIPSLL